MLIPKLNIDIRNWSQDMWVLGSGNLKSKDPPLIGTEIKVGSTILIHIFTLTYMKVKLIGVHIIQKASI